MRYADKLCDSYAHIISGLTGKGFKTKPLKVITWK
jgi:hypothetical protein